MRGFLIVGMEGIGDPGLMETLRKLGIEIINDVKETDGKDIWAIDLTGITKDVEPMTRKIGQKSLGTGIKIIYVTREIDRIVRVRMKKNPGTELRKVICNIREEQIRMMDTIEKLMLRGYEILEIDSGMIADNNSSEIRRLELFCANR